MKRQIFFLTLFALSLLVLNACKDDDDNGDGGVSGQTQTFDANGVSFDMVRVEGGAFMMGTTAEQEGEAESDEYPAHEVLLSSYFVGKTEVTQELWEAVMGDNPSRSIGAKKPVDGVSWDDCQQFIAKLNKITRRKFRLPTEAEWEYAARGGNKSNGYKYAGSDNIDEVAWYDVNARYAYNVEDRGAHDVGTKAANELGIYDMSGNLWEWCQDWYGADYYSHSPKKNPKGPSSGDYRVIRNGSWYGTAKGCRITCRSYGAPYYSFITFGFRLAL